MGVTEVRPALRFQGGPDLLGEIHECASVGRCRQDFAPKERFASHGSIVVQTSRKRDPATHAAKRRTPTKPAIRKKQLPGKCNGLLRRVRVRFLRQSSPVQILCKAADLTDASGQRMKSEHPLSLRAWQNATDHSHSLLQRFQS